MIVIKGRIKTYKKAWPPGYPGFYFYYHDGYRNFVYKKREGK